MINPITNLWLSFVAGLLAPIGAVCVLPLYPGFLAYLANQLTTKAKKSTFVKLGLVVTSGVIASMMVFGLIFTSLLQE